MSPEFDRTRRQSKSNDFRLGFLSVYNTSLLGSWPVSRLNHKRGALSSVSCTELRNGGLRPENLSQDIQTPMYPADDNPRCRLIKTIVSGQRSSSRPVRLVWTLAALQRNGRRPMHLSDA
ncbi:hypothetical protein B0H14DRAFT_3129222 [Mycena olivaceomarginata]|nr:hypothetical protein B0H14DRAFT_3129222 [Mycena olivaceomarginata]